MKEGEEVLVVDFARKVDKIFKTGSESSRSELEPRSCQMLLKAGVYSYYYNYWSQQYCRLESWLDQLAILRFYIVVLGPTRQMLQQ